MASTIKLKNGSGAPTSGQLVQGEPALDLTNKRLYTENASGTVIEVGTNPSSLTTASADINGGTIDGTVIGGSSAAAGSFTTISASGEIAANGGVAFGDNDKATFGAGSDLQIYHDGSNSFISDQGSGNLTLLGGNFRLRDTTNVTDSILANPANYVKLYYAGDEKLSTVSDGIDVNGEITADALTINSSGVQIGTILQSTSTVSSRLALMDANTTSGSQVGIGATGNTLGLYAAGGTPKVVVSATGIDVTGTVVADGLSVSGTTNTPTVFESSAAASYVQFKDSGTTTDNNNRIGSIGDTLTLWSGGSKAVTIDASQNVGIGTASPASLLHLAKATGGAGSSPLEINIDSTFNGTWTADTDWAHINFRVPNESSAPDGDTHIQIAANSGSSTAGSVNDLVFRVKEVSSGTLTERMRVDYDGTISFADKDASETMRIDSSGNLLVGKTSTTLATTGAEIRSDGFIRSTVSDATCLQVNRITGTGTAIDLRYDGTSVGSIVVTASATAYNTSSDYRLKENVVSMDNASDRVLALNPVRFNFIADPEKTVDGFLAHEAQEVVPEAVTGSKDAMRTEEYEVSPAVYEDVIIPAVEEVLDEEGNVITEAQPERTEQRLVSEAVMSTREVPDYQGIDQSKLVPLLTKALQEALQRIEALEAKLA